MPVRGYRLDIDWGRSGSYIGVYDDVSSRTSGDDIVVTWGRDQSTATSRPSAGKLTFALTNLDRRFSPENTGSPIAGQVVPGTPTRIQVTHDDTIHTLHAGVIDTVDAEPGAGNPCSGESVDMWGLLSGKRLSTPLYQGLRTGDAINAILDAVGWTGGRDLDPGATVMPHWWVEDDDAAAAVDKLLRSEGPPAAAYVEAGVFLFRDRHHRVTRAASVTSQGMYTHVIPAGTGPSGDYKIERGSFRYDHGLANIANRVEFVVEQRAPSADVTQVWSTDDTITLASGESTDLFAQAPDPFINAVTPVADVDYTVVSGAVTTSLSRTSGQSLIVTVTASSTAVVTGMAVRAVPLAVARTVKATASDQASISQFGERAWDETDCGFAGAGDAQAIANRIVAIHGTNRPTVAFTIGWIYGGTIPDRYLTQILSRRLGDRVTVRNDALGLNADFIVERITHTIRKLGVIHRIELGCSVVDPGQPTNVLTFNVAGKGFNDGAFGVDGIDNPSTVLRFDTAGQGFNDGVFGN